MHLLGKQSTKGRFFCVSGTFSTPRWKGCHITISEKKQRNPNPFPIGIKFGFLLYGGADTRTPSRSFHSLGQLRNSRPASLSFAALLCSADFRLVFASRTAHWADTRTPSRSFHSLGQLRNSGLASLWFAGLLCSADFRLVFASRTAHWAGTRLRPSAMRFGKTVEAKRCNSIVQHKKRPSTKHGLVLCGA